MLITSGGFLINVPTGTLFSVCNAYISSFRVRDRVRDRDMGRVRVRLRGLAIAAPSYSGP